MKSDESAYSIVPSNLSSRFSISTTQTSRPGNTDNLTDMEYHPLSFDDDLFTARVYKRNYRTKVSHRNRKQSPPDGPSAIITQTDKHQSQVEIDESLRQLLVDRAEITTSNSSEIANEGVEDDAEYITIGPNSILVTTTISITSQGGSDNLDDSITSASFSYVDLVLACRRGDNDLVKK